MMQLQHFVHRKVVVLHSEAPILQAARAMCNREVGCVVLCDRNDSITGILTDRDIVYAVACEGVDVNRPVSEVMTADPLTVPESATLEDVIRVMVENGIRRIPVVHVDGDKRKCVGLVTLDDLLANQAIDQYNTAKIVKAQMYAKATSSISYRTERAENRSEAHREQTLNHFFNQIEAETKLFRAAVPQIALFILGSIVQRLQYSGAAHFIAQLPADLHEDLLDLPAGPNRTFTADSILRGVMSRCQIDMSAAKTVVRGFFRTLQSTIGENGLDHLRMQMPDEIRALFPDDVDEQARTGGSIDPVLFEARH